MRYLDNLPALRHPDLLVGIDGGDDAAVFRLADDLALVQSVDFFSPIADEGYDWGRIVAANALSDLYAMGARPITALQLVGWPRDKLPFSILGETMCGGAAVLAEAGCLLVGGHSIDDREPKYGMAVTGLAHPDEIVTNVGARPGDALVLTKPIGTGLLATGIKNGSISAQDRRRAVEVMAHLNAGASRAMLRARARAATDVTGFGLLGHLEEMIRGAGVGVEVFCASVPILPGAATFAAEGAAPGGTLRNLSHSEAFTDFGVADATMRLLLADAQTSGGLLIAVGPDRLDELLDGLVAEETPAAAVIGRFTDEAAGRISLA